MKGSFSVSLGLSKKPSQRHIFGASKLAECTLIIYMNYYVL